MGFGREVEEGGRDLLCMEACRLQEGADCFSTRQKATGGSQQRVA